MLVACAGPPPAPPAARQALAPTGVLRVAVYPGSPTSLVREAERAQMRGLTVELGDELGRRLGVPVQVVVKPRVAEVVGALERGEADVTVTNATAERMRSLDFAPTLVALELGVLTRAGVPPVAAAAMDRPGLRLGVSQGSSSQRVLQAQLTQATLQPQASLEAAATALADGRLDAFATNKAILHELADRLPGAALSADRWGLEQLALATGKGRDPAAAAYLKDFTAAVQRNGLVQRAADRAGLRGLAPAP